MSSSMVEEIPADLVDNLRVTFQSGRTRSLHFRLKQLKALHRMLVQEEVRFQDALYADLRRCALEVSMFEYQMTRNDIAHIIINFWDWLKPETPKTSPISVFDTVQIRYEPYGVAFIIGSWNYPLMLTLPPLAGAIAAGNCALVKVSEVAYHTGHLLAELIPQYLDPECYQIVEGGPDETTELLKEHFDYIFFTGSQRVGRIVHKAALKHHTPVTLELGGKSPTFVDENSNFDIVARRLIWGKSLNAGQTCVAPDYILCTKKAQELLIPACQRAITKFFGQDMQLSKDYARIINDFHYNRLVQMMQKAEIALGGRCDASERFIELTIMTNVLPSDPVMQEEIFGPLLPIVNINGIDDAIEFINDREKPLALYIFTNSTANAEKLLTQTSSGGACVNDIILQYSTDNLPFGGVGGSGFGAYRGRYSIETFSHKKSCVMRDLGAFTEAMTYARYAPFTKFNMGIIRLILNHRKYPPVAWMKNYLIFFLGVAVAAAYFYYSK